MEELNNLIRTLLDEIRSGAKNWEQEKILVAEARLRSILRVEPPPIDVTVTRRSMMVLFDDELYNTQTKYVEYDNDTTIRDIYRALLPNESTWKDYVARAGRKFLWLNEFVNDYKDYAFLKLVPADLYAT